MNISYDVVQQAIRYYELAGYTYVEVPWVISKRVIMVTAPSCIEPNSIHEESLVASGEQSFLQMILDKKLAPGKYCCATPCYRKFDGLKKDGLHFAQFFKVELINTHSAHSGSFLLGEMIKDAMTFMSKIRNEDLDFIKTEDDPRIECSTFVNYDIVTRQGVELGSYGIRSHRLCGLWMYGTGAAFPRLLH